MDHNMSELGAYTPFRATGDFFPWLPFWDPCMLSMARFSPSPSHSFPHPMNTMMPLPDPHMVSMVPTHSQEDYHPIANPNNVLWSVAALQIHSINP
jgi:hypothetical protein